MLILLVRLNEWKTTQLTIVAQLSDWLCLCVSEWVRLCLHWYTRTKETRQRKRERVRESICQEQDILFLMYLRKLIKEEIQVARGIHFCSFFAVLAILFLLCAFVVVMTQRESNCIAFTQAHAETEREKREKRGNRREGCVACVVKGLFLSLTLTLTSILYLIDSSEIHFISRDT